MPTFAPHFRHRRIFGARSVRRSIRLRPSFPDAAPAGAARRTDPEGHQDLQARGPHRPAGRQEEKLKEPDSRDSSEEPADEPEGAEEGRSAGEHADAEQGEREVEVGQLALWEEEDRDPCKERKPQGAQDGEAEACQWIAHDHDRSSGPPRYARWAISTCRYRCPELIIRRRRPKALLPRDGMRA